MTDLLPTGLTAEQAAEKIAWPLERKVEETNHLLEQFVSWTRMNGYKGAYVAYSGGKDSSVLLHIIRSNSLLARLGVPAVFHDTGLEYPEVRELAFRNADEVTRPRMSFVEVVRRFGYPAVSKEVAHKLAALQNPHDGNQATRRLYLRGIRRDGVYVSRARLPRRWASLVDSGIRISDYCCDVMKKDPAKRYENASGRIPILGILAVESSKRYTRWLSTGCNALRGKRPKCTPMAFWSEDDVLRYARDNGVELPSVYGSIAEGTDGRLHCSGVKRTGCVFCAFGCHMEGPRHRFWLLAETHPQLWQYCCRVLRTHEVLAAMGVSVPPTGMQKLTRKRRPQ